MRVALVVAALAACSSDPHELVINSQRQPIIGGSTTHVGQFPSVVAVFIPGGLCTGTLITPTTVVTAAHCVDPAELGKTSAEIVAGTTVILDRPSLFVQGGRTIAAAEIFEHPTHPDFTAANIDFGHDDIALIRLAEPVTDRPTSPIDLTKENNKVGTKTTQVGYGINKAVPTTPGSSSTSPGNLSSAVRLPAVASST